MVTSIFSETIVWTDLHKIRFKTKFPLRLILEEIKVFELFFNKQLFYVINLFSNTALTRRFMFDVLENTELGLFL